MASGKGGVGIMSVGFFVPDERPVVWRGPMRVVRMAVETGATVAGVVENMSALVCHCCREPTAIFGSGGGAVLAAEAGAPLLGQVVLDIELREAGDRGVPVVLAAPEAAPARELTRIAGILPAPRPVLVGRSLPLSVVSR
ncbi:P-loop NTPase [Pseudonocardia asaccharolytica]|uniref:Uncharacterized protein n=1 Tax=Pseudonocardia asaccharolytica DSM 44247 = NBRC 16224 TaxID=1123024 RepID=A0A511CYW6_9PSEU|nr:P-loop NTPase [Pseudonocardia asaccharolytica]GEL17752.1 hypothetical protein PA7_15890 [Pseudonocardia asaccharolytica DSM 44247 = NBRC 16224]